MIFEIKDLIYIAVYVASMAGVLAAMKYRVEKIEAANADIKQAVFQKKGGLNVVDNAACRDHRTVINRKIDHESETTQRAFEVIENLNQNIIKIMMHMKLEPIRKRGGS